VADGSSHYQLTPHSSSEGVATRRDHASVAGKRSEPAKAAQNEGDDEVGVRGVEQAVVLLVAKAVGDMARPVAVQHLKDVLVVNRTESFEELGVPVGVGKLVLEGERFGPLTADHLGDAARAAAKAAEHVHWLASACGGEGFFDQAGVAARVRRESSSEDHARRHRRGHSPPHLGEGIGPQCACRRRRPPIERLDIRRVVDRRRHVEYGGDIVQVTTMTRAGLLPQGPREVLAHPLLGRPVCSRVAVEERDELVRVTGVSEVSAVTERRPGGEKLSRDL